MAHKFLSDVPEDKVFWLSNGNNLRNLKELRNALTGIPDEIFYRHVDANHNDFSNWIREVIGDKILANEIQKSMSIYDHILKINSRIMDIEGSGHKIPQKPAKKKARKAVSRKSVKRSRSRKRK